MGCPYRSRLFTTDRIIQAQRTHSGDGISSLGIILMLRPERKNIIKFNHMACYDAAKSQRFVSPRLVANNIFIQQPAQ